MGEVAHLDQWNSKSFTKALSTTKFECEQNDVTKVEGISWGNVESWYIPRELKGFPSRFIKNILFNISNHAKTPEEINAAKNL